jgi:phosphatidylglycerol:prolipoprotein diacylglycerol transferase
MKPVLFALKLPVFGEVTFPAYFTLLTIGFALATWMTWRESKRIKLDPELIIDTNLWMVVWGIIGARVLHLVADGHFHEYVDLCVNPKAVKAVDALVSYCTGDAQCYPEDTFLGFKIGFPYLCDLATHTCHPARDCFAAFEVWRGGLAYYGGFIFASLFCIYFCRKHHMAWGRIGDLAAPAIALGLFFGRLGCYLNGCCYGKETRSAIGVVFPKYGPAWRAQLDAGHISATASALPVHPTQLYEAGACLAISMILYYLVRPRKRADFDVFASLLILYGFARSVIEVFRDDDRGVFFGGYVSTSQLLSIPLVVVGLLVLWRNRRPGKPAMWA